MKIRRQFQEEGHCGPTCISMLLEAQDKYFAPREIARAAGVTQTIEKIGSRIDQLSIAVEALAPDVVVLGKFNTSLADVEQIINHFDLAVGVEWQGRFFSDTEPFDIGHFSLIVKVDREKELLDLIDPDRKSFFVDAKIGVPEFESRWWEDNELDLGRKSRSFRLSFVVVKRATQQVMIELGFEPVTFDFVRQASVDPSQ